MSESDDKVRSDLIRTLLQGRGKLPTSSVGRLGRTAFAALRTGRALLGRKIRGKDEIDVKTMVKIITSIGRLKGVAMKMGQIMSYIDIALPDELRNALSVLQTHAQPMPVDQVREILAQELGDAGKELARGLDPVPLAAASIGQVHRAEIKGRPPLAVKVQYPGIETAILSDFRPAAMGTHIAALVYPGAEIDAFIAEVRDRFLEECDYEHEARAQQRFFELFQGHRVITVPRVHEDLCSRRVFTADFVRGLHFDDFLATSPPQEIRDRMGQALFEFYVGSLFLHGLYNCDPHPGNYLFLSDGRMAMLDYGCTREFEPGFVKKLARLTLAVHEDTKDALHAAFLDLDMVKKGKNYDFETARRLVRSFFGPMLRDEAQVVDLGEAMSMREAFEGKRELLKLTLPGEFVFLFRIRFGLMSILARLGARANWYRLERGYVDSFVE
jgi:predicted unusual protein kinase regulating ubiquinone biosynthesis (AarF/ABC1/UbiB family)